MHLKKCLTFGFTSRNTLLLFCSLYNYPIIIFNYNIINNINKALGIKIRCLPEQRAGRLLQPYNRAHAFFQLLKRSLRLCGILPLYRKIHL